MEHDHRNILKKLTLKFRTMLEGTYDEQGNMIPGDLETRLNQMGVWRDRVIPLDEIQLSEDEKETRRIIDAYIDFRTKSNVSLSDAFREFVQESAYTWFNRLFALRCMETRGIIDEVVIQRDTYSGRSLKHRRLILRNPEYGNKPDEGLYELLEGEFTELSKELPSAFNPHNPATLLRPTVSTLKELLSLLSGLEAINGLFATDDTFLAPDVFGWAYQYWNLDEKDRVFEKVRENKEKITGSDVIPVTCLYTEPYMVKFLVQNTLGAHWMCMYPESKLEHKWEYFVHDVDRTRIPTKPLSEITFLDPACGSGHFLLEAFDLFYDMYLEEGEIDPLEIPKSILENNLYGLDIDERAVHIAQVSLWMKAKLRAPDLDTTNVDGFHNHYIAANIRLPSDGTHLDVYLDKHPEDNRLKPAIKSILSSLENSHELGSLLLIDKIINNAFLGAQKHGKIQTSFSGPMSRVEFATWQNDILMRLKTHFNKEASASENIHSFVNQTANKGVLLIDLLTQEYDLVVTNPPYMGSKHMDDLLKNYLKDNYPEGRSDLFSAFMQRCILFTKQGGHVGLVTQQSWLFLKSFKDLRAGNIIESEYTSGILPNVTIDLLAHLGHGAFEEISGEVVNVVLSVFNNRKPTSDHKLSALRLVNYPSIPEKKEALENYSTSDLYKKEQSWFLSIEQTPLCYWIGDHFFKLLRGDRMENHADIVQGLATANDKRFVRYNWEVTNPNRWVLFEKGGGYGRWSGHQYWRVDWEYDGARIRNSPSPRVQNEKYYRKSGWTYSDFAGGSIGPRKISNSIFSTVSPAAILRNSEPIGALLFSRINSYLIRSISAQTNHLRESYMRRLPFPAKYPGELLSKYENLCYNLKKTLDSSQLIENSFTSRSLHMDNLSLHRLSMQLHTYEGFIEYLVMKSYGLSESDIAEIVKDTGTPSGWYPILEDIQSVDLKFILDDESLNQYIESLETVRTNDIEYSKIKSKIKNIYENYTLFDSKVKLSGTKLPIPSETLLEQISHLVQLNPISVYAIIHNGVNAEGWIAIKQEQLDLENYVSISILEVFGHRWASQYDDNTTSCLIENGDEILLLSENQQGPSLYEKLIHHINGKDILKYDDIETVFYKLMGKQLKQWIQTDFFKHHITQLKNRPILWKIQSSPPQRSHTPAFSCLIYYHKLNKDTLPKIRTQYIGPLIESLRLEYSTLNQYGKLTELQTERRTFLQNAIEELENLNEKVKVIIDQGFYSHTLLDILSQEPIDSWCKNSVNTLSPTTIEEFAIQEQIYEPDLNDGVRVNIAPLQKWGVIPAKVLASKDIEDALLSRVLWRSDERRLCRKGFITSPSYWQSITS